MTVLANSLSRGLRTRRRPPEVRTNRLHRTPAEFTTRALDGGGLCGHLPARPAGKASYPVLVHRVAALLRVLQPPPRDDALALRHSFAAIGLEIEDFAPTSYQSCSAQKKGGQTAALTVTPYGYGLLLFRAERTHVAAGHGVVAGTRSRVAGAGVSFPGSGPSLASIVVPAPSGRLLHSVGFAGSGRKGVSPGRP